MAESKANKSCFDTLNGVNVSAKVEKKNGLTYLSWAWAWAEVKKRYPDANYEIVKYNGIPYVYDPNTGYMVYTKVTIGGITHEMWLPVMDSNNCAMKAEPYDIQTKYKTITIKPATMFDINKTIMRCLTKNLAMHGLGLYIYAGEDLPESDGENVVEEPKTAPKRQGTASKKGSVPKCSRCSGDIVDYGKYTAGWIAEESTKKLGKPICMKCWIEMAEAKKQAKMDGEYQAIQNEDAGDRV